MKSIHGVYLTMIYILATIKFSDTEKKRSWISGIHISDPIHIFTNLVQNQIIKCRCSKYQATLAISTEYPIDYMFSILSVWGLGRAFSNIF